ncbi:MAG: M17 family peptidase N-terminal domain-containing protein [Myxococcota bacterium]
MSVTLAVAVEDSPLPKVETDVLVAPFFAEDRPLRGPAAWADWRLCGLLDEALGTGRMPTGLGEATLAPSGGRLAARRVLVLGLGARDALGFAELRTAANRAAESLLRLRAADVAFAVPSQELTGIVPELAAELVVEAFADAVAHTPRALRLRVVLAEDDARSALHALRALPVDLIGGAVALRVERHIVTQPEPQLEPPARPAPPAPRPGVTVRRPQVKVRNLRV